MKALVLMSLLFSSDSVLACSADAFRASLHHDISFSMSADAALISSLDFAAAEFCLAEALQDTNATEWKVRSDELLGMSDGTSALGYLAAMLTALTTGDRNDVILLLNEFDELDVVGLGNGYAIKMLQDQFCNDATLADSSLCRTELAAVDVQLPKQFVWQAMSAAWHARVTPRTFSDMKN